MSKNKQYIVVESTDVEGLQQLVTDHLKNGWTLVGGVSVNCWSYHNPREGYDENCSNYAQAMTK